MSIHHNVIVKIYIFYRRYQEPLFHSGKYLMLLETRCSYKRYDLTMKFIDKRLVFVILFVAYLTVA